MPDHKYKESEDPRKIEVKKTNPSRGPLKEGWSNDKKPVMCAYKIVKTKFEVWGLQTKVESWSQRAVREILLLAHRQAYCWTDEWYDKTYVEIVEFERDTYAKTNEKVKGGSNNINSKLDNDKNCLNDNVEKDIADFD